MPEGEKVEAERAKVEAERAKAQAERAKIGAERAKAQAESAEEKIHFVDYWRVVKKRKEIIIAILAIAVFGTFVYSTIKDPTYSAYSQIKISQWQRPMDPFSTEPSRYLAFDQYEFETHRASLENDPVLEKVVKGEIYSNRSFWQCPLHPQLKLNDARAESLAFTCPVAGCGNSLEEVREKKYPTWEPLDRKWARLANYPGGRYRIETAVSILKSNLKVRPEKGTRLITITYESHDKKEAQLIADMVAEAYMQWTEELRDESLQGAFKALQKQVRFYQYGGPGEGRGLNEEQAEMIKMKGQLNLDTNDHLTQYVQLAQWTHTRDETRAKIAETKTEVEKLSAMTDDEKVNSIQNNAAIYQLAIQLGTEEARLNYLLAQYGDGHMEIIGQREKIKALKTNLSALANGYLDSIEADLAKNEAYEKELSDIIKRINEEIAKSQPAYSKYLISKSDVDMKIGLLQRMEQTQIEKRITNAIPTVDIQLVQRSRLPGAPIRPRPMFNVIISIFVGLTLGTGVAYFVEYMDTSMKTVDDIERSLKLSTLAVIPKLKEGLLIHENPRSRPAESYRMLWTNIQFSRKQSGFKKIMITSGDAGEGKTTTVVNLGVAAAQMGAKVLLVDSDLRRPKIHKLLKYSNRRGLYDVLVEDVDPADVIVKTSVPGLLAMPSGKLPANTNIIGLLNSQKMRDVVSTLSEEFDVLLFDSPPVMVVSDALVMASVVDRVLLVINGDKPPKRFARRAKKTLEDVGGELLGTVINNLSIQRGDYYYYGYGYGYGKSYYSYYLRSEEEEPEEKQPVGAAEATDSAASDSNSDTQSTA